VAKEAGDVEVDGDGAVAERPLERDAHEPVGAGQKPLRGERRPKDVLEEGLATFLVVGPGSRGGVQAEAHFAYRKRRCDNDAGAAVEGDLHGAAAELGAGGREAGDGGSRELSESWIALGESVIDAEDVGVDVDDVAPLEVREDAGAGDLERIGHVIGRKSGKHPELETAVRGRGVHAVQEDDVEVRSTGSQRRRA